MDNKRINKETRMEHRIMMRAMNIKRKSIDKRIVARDISEALIEMS